VTHQLAGTVVHNHEPFPTAFPPSGTLTDVSLSYQSQGTVPKHFAMRMQRRGLSPPSEEGQLSEAMTAGGHADGTGGAPSAHHTPEERGCPSHSCSHRGRALTPVLGLGVLARLGGSRWKQIRTTPECATLVEKAQLWDIVLRSCCLLLALSPPLLIAFGGGQERNVTCCMTDSPSSSSANLGPYFERPLKEKGLCAL